MMYRRTNSTTMRYLYMTISAISVVLWIQQQHKQGIRTGIFVVAKKPSRPVGGSISGSSRPRQQQSVPGGGTAKGKSKQSPPPQQRPLARKAPPTAIADDDDYEAIDSISTEPDFDDDADEDDDVVIPRQSTTNNQRMGTTAGRPTPPRPMNGKTGSAPRSNYDDDDDYDNEMIDDDDEIENEDDDLYNTVQQPRRSNHPQQQRHHQQKQLPPQRGQQQRLSPNQKPAFVGRRNGPPPSSSSSSKNTNRNNNSRTQQQQQRRRPNTNDSSNSRRNSGGRVVPYSRPPPPGYGAAAVLAQSWSGLVNSLPDPTIVKEAALSSINAAKQTTSNLSANIYREVKGLTSSELEQVMLKATRPDDTAVKGKHVERLVGVTYQISSRYDIYDAVLRKLWSKMAEKDWRTTIKALYILHRFSADGSPEHAPSLKARLRELRRSRDPKRKDKFFNQKQLLAGDITPGNIKFRAFMGRYANYVLLRAQSFSGMFEEISSLPPVKTDAKKKAVPQKPITSTSLRNENLKAAELLLNAGMACQLRDGEICENTAIAAERVASDMMELSSSVAMALNRVLKESTIPKGTDIALLKSWCTFYIEQLLPQTKLMVKKMSPNLDVFGLYLPSRMGTNVPPNLIEKGLNLVVEEEENEKDDVAKALDKEGTSGTDNKAKRLAEPDVSKKISTPVESTTTSIPQKESPAAAGSIKDDDDEEEEEADEVEDKELADEGGDANEAEDDDDYEYEEEEEEEEDDEEEDGDDEYDE